MEARIKAPGKAHTGISLIDLLAKFPDDEKAESWFRGVAATERPSTEVVVDYGL